MFSFPFYCSGVPAANALHGRKAVPGEIRLQMSCMGGRQVRVKYGC